MACESSEKIKLVLINGRVMTFNADDYLKLRKDHRIVGKLIGVAPPYPKNVILTHLPAIFSEYETKLMLEEHIAILEEKSDLKREPTERMRKDFEAHQLAVIEELTKPYIDSKLNTVRVNMESIIKGKRKKLIQSGVPEEEINITEEDIIKDEETKLKQTLNPKSCFSQIPTEHPFHSEVRIISDYPVRSKAKYKVFKNLWHKQLFITNGESFGGDFLTYPSDPNLFHASQIVHIIDRDTKFDHHFLSSCSRLSVSVKKKCVFAYLDEHESVVYQTIEWINPKLRELYANNVTTTAAVENAVQQPEGESDNEMEVEEGETPCK